MTASDRVVVTWSRSLMYARLQFLDFIMTRRKKDAKSILGVVAPIFPSRPLKIVNSVNVKSDPPIIQTA
jgi:hypothetical protein